MTPADIEPVVRELTGLDSGALGDTALPRAVEKRMGLLAIASVDSYAEVLRRNSSELDALSAELLVPETWFFRGGRALFDRLADHLKAMARTPDKLDVVRVLSVPCSTGEEPYSLAIALQDRGLTPSQYHIDAVDLSPRHLAAAELARYPTGSFRELGDDVRPRCFRPVGEQWELLPHLRESVRFHRANLTSPDFLAAHRPYDLIFCRNLFIYLSPEGRKAAVAALDRLLAPGGLLCLSMAEADRLPRDRFVPDGSGISGIYRRVESASAGASAPVAKLPPAARGKAVPPPARIRTAPAQRAATVATPTLAPAPSRSTSEPTELESIRKLADAGRLEEALAACEKYTDSKPSCAAAHVLTGVIRLARGDAVSAERALRKALYIEPENPEAITHMILVCERRGDAAQAALLRARLALRGGEDRS